MHLKHIELTNFKNYESVSLDFSPRFNCFVGNNGVGKTNILDAIHYLSLTKSFFNNSDALSIRHGEDYFILKGEFEKDGETDELHCAFQKQKAKIFKRNGREYQKLSDHVGRFPVVMVSPADSTLITEGGEERRRFLNIIISQYDPEYLDAHMRYNRVLMQRNKVLREASGRNDASSLLELYDDQMAPLAELIYRARKELTENLIPLFSDYYARISNSAESVSVRYRSHLSEPDYRALLIESRERDMDLQYTTSGIHRDDLVFEIDGHSVRTTSSQGQQKSFLVALKLAKFGYICRRNGFPPALLLDDIFDKFDETRVKEIIKLVGSDDFGQVFITDTHKERIHRILDNTGVGFRLYHIGKNGIEEEISNGKNI
jgi:DNA replication and repair protein RecF